MLLVMELYGPLYISANRFLYIHELNVRVKNNSGGKGRGHNRKETWSREPPAFTYDRQKARRKPYVWVECKKEPQRGKQKHIGIQGLAHREMKGY